MTVTVPPNTRLQGRRLLAARVVWLILAALSLTMAAVAIPSVVHTDDFVCPEETCFAPALSPADQINLGKLGLSLETYANFFTVVETLPEFFAWIFVAIIIFWRKSDDWMAILTSIFLMTFLTAIGSGNQFDHPIWRWPSLALRMIGPSLFILIFYIFPDGRFAPRWARWVVIPLAVSALGIVVLQFIPALEPLAIPSNILYASLLLLAFVSQAYRYWRVSTPVQRQQTRWVVMAGFMVPFSDLVVRGVILPALLPWPHQPGVERVIYNMVTIPIFRAVPFVLFPVSFGVAILRYKLWNIDVLIRRTLVYSLLTGALVLVYLSVVLLLQEVVSTILGESSNPVTVVVSTLTVAALFGYLRVRIQNFIDRRFYRQKYDAEQVMGAFNDRLREKVDVDAVAGTILEVIEQTMQPSRLGIWMKEQGRTGDRGG